MKSVNIIGLLAISSIIFSCTSEQKEKPTSKLTFANPEEVGMLADSLANIDTLVMEFVEAKKYPGAVTLIAKNGKIIYESEVGWSDSLQTIPYRKNHLFRMASMTKPLVSVAIMQLVERGKIHLNDSVGKYIESFKATTVLTGFEPSDSTWTDKPSNSAPTIHQLLTHTAGVPYGFMNPKVNGAILAKNNIPDLSTFQPWTIQETMEKIGDIPLVHEPGSKWMYGLNTDVLGRIVEVASGMKLDKYINVNITQPLGMETFKFYYADSMASNLTNVFVSNSDKQFMNMQPSPPFYTPNYPVEGAKTYFSGGSGMTGTARDYFLFCQAMLNDGKLGENRILKAETAKMMHQDQIDTITYPWGPARFGYGFDIAKDNPNRPDGAYSWGGAFSTTFWIDPTNELIVIQLRQVLASPHNKDINAQLEKIVYGAFTVK